MKKIVTAMLCFVAFGVVGCKKNEPVAVPKDVKSTFIAGLDDSFPPMGFRDADNNIVGFDIDLAREVSSRLKLELVLQPIDWASKELELNNGNIDCIWNGLSVDPLRQEAMLLSKPYLANQMIILVPSASPISTKAQLNGKQVGLQAGSTAVSAFKKDAISKDSKMVEYENNVLAMSDLKVGRVDAVVMDEVVARYLISKDEGTFKILDDNFGKEVYAVGFKKGNTELANKVNKTLADMVADGTSDNISKKWFGEVIILK